MQAQSTTFAVLPELSQRPTRSLRAKGRPRPTASEPIARTISIAPAQIADRPSAEPRATWMPQGDTRHGILCMASGLLGISLGVSGLYAVPQVAGQVLALGVIVVSALVCEFAFNALWDSSKA